MTSNIVLKVRKRKRRRGDSTAEVPGGDGAVGEYIVEAVGIVTKTARFRSKSWSLIHLCVVGSSWYAVVGMADFQ